MDTVVLDVTRPVPLTVEAREGERVSLPSSVGKPLALALALFADFNAASEGRGVAGIAVYVEALEDVADEAREWGLLPLKSSEEDEEL